MINNGIRRISLIAILFAITAVCVGGVFCPDPADGTSQYMTVLPAYSTYQCAICHSAQLPTQANHDLNPFGEDFRDNGYVWNKTLASKNSDGDKCSNGFELGDENGDGILDEPGGKENGNPGVSDCTITLDRQTWGIIKELFSSE
jgi:hypothetical protein